MNRPSGFNAESWLISLDIVELGVTEQLASFCTTVVPLSTLSERFDVAEVR